MGLQIWLPLNGDLTNQGLDQTVAITNSGATVNTDGKIGKCYAFDGTQYVKVQSPYLKSYLSDSTVPFSMACWIYLNSDETDRVIIFGNYNANPFVNWELLGSGVQRLAAGGTSNYMNKDGGTATPKIKWTHLAVSYDGTKTTFYMNGKQIYTVNGVNTITAVQGSDTWYLGSDVRSGATRLKGRINDFRFYDHCLSAEEVKWISQGLTLHYSLSNRGFGGDNLLRNSLNIGMNGSDGTYKTIRTFNSQTHIGKVEVSDTEHSQNSWRFVGAELGGSSMVQELTTGENTYTFSCDVKVTNYTTGKVRIGFDFRTSSVSASTIYTLETNEYDGNWHRVSMQITTNNSQNTQALWGINTAGTVHGSLTVIEYKNPKLERGSRATPWIPNSADALYSSLQLGSTTEHDLSGYQYNGIKNNVANDTDSPVNQGCYVFNGTNSWVRCDTNEWMVQGATEFTVNWWAYDEDWTAVTNGGRMVSCTESGGFNTEGGATGYLRFPHYVFTNEAKTSRAYQYNNNGIKLADLTPGWHMFTLVYDLTGEKIYIDGTLHSSANSTSYGISFNTNARLYLGCEASSANPSTPYFNGKMSDFRFYYTVLSADEIADLYGGGAA